jgi:hypothetical protein
MRRLAILILALVLLAPPDQAFAHGFGQRQDIPLPFWLYLFGINAVILATFVMIALSFDEPHAPRRYPRIDLLSVGPLRAVLTNRPFLLGVRLLSVALFLLVVLSGLLGEQVPEYNFAPTFVWIIWWVGLVLFTALVGNVWPLLNPWRILFEWADGLVRRLGFNRGLEMGVPYPAGWGVWPAVVLYALFVWVENVFEGASIPSNIAVLILLYSMLTWAGMIVFGKYAWLRRGEVFSVFFGILAKFAPTEVRVIDKKFCKDCRGACLCVKEGCMNCYECFERAAPEARELDLRPPAVGLSLVRQTTPDYLVFVILILASVTYDSLLTTPFGAGLEDLLPMPRTLGLFALPLFFLAVYLVFMKLSQLFAGGRVLFGRLSGAYVYSFVPIAVVYQVAHYYTYFLVQGQQIIRLFSDPFGWGWNLFGTAGYRIHAGIVDAAFVWYSQIALILAGHVVAVYLAHVVALHLFRDPMRTARSQYPMAALMVLYTILGLWILTQPTVEQNGTTATIGADPARAETPAAVLYTGPS